MTAAELGQPLWVAAANTALALVSAIRGETSHAESLLAGAEAFALPAGASVVLADIQLGRATIALGAGRHEEAFEHLWRTFDPQDPAHHSRSAWLIGELSEAALRVGRADEARKWLAQCEQLGRVDPSPRLRVGLLYARTLLAADDDAEALFEASLSEDLSSWPLYWARLSLQYGIWLRRRRKIGQARPPLRAARDSLLALGATPWADRARQELRASRETQHNGPGAWMQLTEQELQIAHMAAQGLSNREIGQRLYVSPRTVGSHLYRIFPKLGIASRGQLVAALAGTRPCAIACRPVSKCSTIADNSGLLPTTSVV
jgi:ATP/maltotriose-dependent transcriptional regulator MalT